VDEARWDVREGTATQLSHHRFAGTLLEVELSRYEESIQVPFPAVTL